MFVASGDEVKGDLGVDPLTDPRNDGSIPSKEKANAISLSDVDEATIEQWASIKRLLGDAFGEYTASDVISWFGEKGVKLSTQELIGSPDGKGLPRIGYGALDTEKAIEMLSLLTIEAHKEE